MKHTRISRHRGFTLIETVIAIGVLAVLLTGFMVVFAPAAEGIRKSINVQQADRLASTLEQELVTLREGQKTADIKTGFDKSYDWIKKSNAAADALMVYQFRGEIGGTLRSDGTPNPVSSIKGKISGKDYSVISMVRRKSDAEFNNDLTALEGAVYLVKCTQLVFDTAGTGGLKLGTPGTIIDPKGSAASSNADAYPEAVIAFSAEFFMMPAKTESYFSGSAFTTKFPNFKNPVFTRNLAVRR
jgi:prepilin-type N-terminal cleavage/methylation domain-containing protein